MVNSYKKAKHFSSNTFNDSPVPFKVIIVGESGVGKTQLASRYLNDNFSPNLQMTIGVEFYTKIIKPMYGETIERPAIAAQMWDTAGTERYQAMTNAYFRGSNAAVIVYDITKTKSFVEVEKWFEKLKEYLPKVKSHKMKSQNGRIDENSNNDEESEVYPIILVANKLDLVKQRSIMTLDGRNMVKKLNLYDFQEVSAYDGTNVRPAFNNFIVNCFNNSLNNTQLFYRNSNNSNSNGAIGKKSAANKCDEKIGESKINTHATSYSDNTVLLTGEDNRCDVAFGSCCSS